MSQKISPRLAMFILLAAAGTLSGALWLESRNSGVSVDSDPVYEKPGERKNWLLKIEKDDVPVVCTEETKKCSDGSHVGRVAPDCEFSACPAIKLGGECEYDKISGTCKIITVLPDKTVRFSFDTDSPIQGHNLQEALSGQQEDFLDRLLLGEEIKINTGDAINCTASLIRSGACTPIIFEFAK